MGLTDRVWNAFTMVIQMRDKIAALTETVRAQQAKLENLTERMVKLETTVDLMMRTGEKRRGVREQRRIEKDS